jgi:salicylate hydroxylase
VSAPHILIAGAGIGGLTAAIALARRGFAVTVTEKRTGFGETGAGIQITPNAGRVLDALDLRLPLKRAAVTSERLVVRRWRDGKTLAEMPMSLNGTDTPFRALRRTDLHTVLLDAARSLPRIRLTVGRGLSDVQQNDDGVIATLVTESGQSETISALALIGADGLWSRTRELTGDKAPPAFTGYEAWRTLIPAPERPAGQVTLHLGTNHHAVHYPVTGGREINLVLIRAAQEAREGWSRDGEPGLPARETAGAAPALRKLVAEAPTWQVWSLFDRPPAAMAKGRIALLGDAAHPVLPFLAQGAALAIEDAAVLARELATHLETDGASAVPAALKAYAKTRQARAARIQAASRANARNYHVGPPWSWGRNLAMKQLGPQGMRSRYDWLYEWRDEG